MNLRLRDRKHERGLTIRIKLTLWYGSLFLLAGVSLQSTSYSFATASPPPTARRESTSKSYMGFPEGMLEPPGDRGTPRTQRVARTAGRGRRAWVWCPCRLSWTTLRTD